MAQNKNDPINLEGRVAIVTGAAQGIGEATAMRLATAGAKVAIVDYNEDGAREAAAGIGEQAIAIHADVAQPDQIQSFVEQTAAKWGRIDILVNNASNVASLGTADADVVSTELDIWDQVYACNLRGPAAACKYAIPQMLKNGSGAIINIASIQGLAGDLVRTAYGSTKAGLIMMSKYVATQFGRQGIRCNSVAPGMVMSPSAHDETVEPFLQIVERHMLTDERGRPMDLAEVITFLASDASRYINGQNITVDGGLLCHQPVYADLMQQQP